MALLMIVAGEALPLVLGNRVTVESLEELTAEEQVQLRQYAAAADLPMGLSALEDTPFFGRFRFVAE